MLTQLSPEALKHQRTSDIYWAVVCRAAAVQERDHSGRSLGLVMAQMATSQARNRAPAAWRNASRITPRCVRPEQPARSRIKLSNSEKSVFRLRPTVRTAIPPRTPDMGKGGTGDTCPDAGSAPSKY